MVSYRSFNEIFEDNKSLENLFINKSEYLAHTNFSKENETLYEHIVKVRDYFIKIIELNKLELVINRLISKVSIGNIEIGNYLKTLFYQAIIFHDFGKINPNFQFERMSNKHFQKDVSIKIGYEHSFLSAYFFLNHSVNNIPGAITKEYRSFIYVFSFLFSIPILKHHSGYIERDYEFSAEKIDSIHKLINLLSLKITKEQILKLVNYESSQNDKNLWAVFNTIAESEHLDYFALFTLLKLNYSLLTTADYYATTAYMNGLEFNTENDFGLLTNELKTKINLHFTNNKKAIYNKKLIENTDYYLKYSFDNLKHKSNENLNILRQKLGAEVLTNIEKHKDKRIFYIEAPTGGGKTNMSMIAVYKMLQIHPEINKIFYVFPFTTLITQTSKAIKDTLGLSENEVTEVHSKAGFKTKDYNNEEDAEYGNERRNQIDNLFVNYPLTLLTHIKFFDILKSNKKDTNYILHRLANSIVIIDELQAYSPEHWDKIKLYISKYAEFFNIRFIVMSATLPKIDKIKMAFDTHFEPLIDNAKENYLQNPNFSERVSIKTELLKNEKIDLEKLSDILLNKSKDYAEKRTDEYKGYIYTIIEFIFKKTASQFYDIIKEKQFFDEIFVLSGTIIEPRRKYIIEYLKDKNNRKKKILLITTQVVEAGVDIDMDLGFKNQSLIDSDEQLAGRINRNVKKQNCELWLFKADTAKSIYGKDERYKITAGFSTDFVNEILTEKKFEELYEKVFEEIDKLNTSAYETNFNTYTDNFKKLNFQNIKEDFKLIDSQNISIFVPADIDINCYGDEKNFSESEIEFIKDNNCLENENQVSGEKIWSLYVSLIQNKEKQFSPDIKILNGIMSKFVFSVFLKTDNKLKEYCEYNEEISDFKYFQYLKLRKDEINQSDNFNNDKVYSLVSGINEDKSNLSFEII